MPSVLASLALFRLASDFPSDDVDCCLNLPKHLDDLRKFLLAIEALTFNETVEQLLDNSTDRTLLRFVVCLFHTTTE